ncbi:unnamed protein product [Phytophthora lilii]|uniref:Unnamed protein product n=1 Tax=Phytophthora lilii TaxID=2077276 RepID=A0A9W6X5N2_9STRA|nr:unnamed protein product [Phytophthora lilii]
MVYTIVVHLYAKEGKDVEEKISKKLVEASNAFATIESGRLDSNSSGAATRCSTHLANVVVGISPALGATVSPNEADVLALPAYTPRLTLGTTDDCKERVNAQCTSAWTRPFESGTHGHGVMVKVLATIFTATLMIVGPPRIL